MGEVAAADQPPPARHDIARRSPRPPYAEQVSLVVISGLALVGRVDGTPTPAVGVPGPDEHLLDGELLRRGAGLLGQRQLEDAVGVLRARLRLSDVVAER